MSLLSTAERLAAIDRSVLVLDPGRCLHSRDRSANCEVCFEICPSGAILPGKPPSLNSGKCQNCLACLPACPVGVFSADDAVAPLLKAVSLLEGGTLEILCASNPEPERGVVENGTGIRVRGCLAGLGSGAYLALAALGLEHIFVRAEACLGCKWASLFPKIEAQVWQAKQLLAAWEKEDVLRLITGLSTNCSRPLWDSENPPLSRRDLFRLAARQGQVAMARAIEKGQGSSDPRPGRDRLRISSAYAHLPEAKIEIQLEPGAFDFATVTISEACTACSACARDCPSGALHFEKSEDEATYRLAFSAHNCIGCEVCRHVCAPGAVTVNHAPGLAKIFSVEETTILQEGALTHCARCRTLMVARPGVTICPLCEYRRAHPFGSIRPSELQAVRSPGRQEIPS